MTNVMRAPIRTLDGWAIRECEEHGWMKDRTDPHARHHAVEIARSDPPPGLSPDQAADELRDVASVRCSSFPPIPQTCFCISLMASLAS